MSVPLYESGNAVADSAGRAVCTVQPLQAFEKWHVTKVTVQNSGTTLVPMCRVYRGSETPSRFIGGTFSGQMDASDENFHLSSGERLLAVFSGADVGSRCVLTVEGEKSR